VGPPPLQAPAAPATLVDGRSFNGTPAVGALFTAREMEFDCGGCTDGTSGGPFLGRVDPSTGDGTVIGVIGGHEQGGNIAPVSYSPGFGRAVQALYQRHDAVQVGEILGGGHPLRGGVRLHLFGHGRPGGRAVTGVVGWSDAAITGPAYDFGLPYRDLGPAALAAAPASYRPGGDVSGIRERAAFYARCAVLEGLAHGIATGQDAHVCQSLAVSGWPFPA
jgi:hypothetical protein